MRPWQCGLQHSVLFLHIRQPDSFRHLCQVVTCHWPPKSRPAHQRHRCRRYRHVGSYIHCHTPQIQQIYSHLKQRWPFFRVFPDQSGPGTDTEQTPNRLLTGKYATEGNKHSGKSSYCDILHVTRHTGYSAE